MADARAMLPRYRSHKIVRAARIEAIEPPGSSGPLTVLVLEHHAGLVVEVSHDYVAKHKPKVGGYFVVYADGYESWSPAEAFEDGYALETAKGSGSATGTGGTGDD